MIAEPVDTARQCASSNLSLASNCHAGDWRPRLEAKRSLLFGDAWTSRTGAQLTRPTVPLPTVERNRLFTKSRLGYAGSVINPWEPSTTALLLTVSTGHCA